MNGDVENSRPVEPEVDNRVTPEMSKILDEVQLQWLEPKSEQITSAAPSISKFDDKPSLWIWLLAFISRSSPHPQRLSL
jgi:hypothetical protein